MNEFLETLAESLRDGSFVQMTLSRPVGGQRADVSRVGIRRIDQDGNRRLQFSLRSKSAETHANLDVVGSIDRCRELLPTFRRCHLFTTNADYSARKQSDGSFKVDQTPATKQLTPAQHNRVKRYLIPQDEPCGFLAAIGVMQADGRVVKSKYHKFRQINRYLELVDDVIKHLPSEGVLRIVDFGCGKSYLTFALHHLLTKLRGRDVDIIGLDLKQTVIDDCSRIAESLDCQGLSFRVGDIANLPMDGDVHLCVSLHACDTATDESIAKGISWQANVILAVPCCQHELAPQLQSPELAAILKHGILRERLAAIATDALRAEYLEANGYHTRIVEFIDMEHTAKNVLIRAVRDSTAASLQKSKLTSADQLVRLLAIEQFTLANRLLDS
ncbi:MAG: SAM-dependent methyltransferase [Planctomycetota bacterium]|nr:SAM-dependent methyltransferase [Planctomycetota bacterium]